jgi:invasion protein IalB
VVVSAASAAAAVVAAVAAVAVSFAATSTGFAGSPATVGMAVAVTAAGTEAVLVVAEPAVGVASAAWTVPCRTSASATEIRTKYDPDFPITLVSHVIGVNASRAQALRGFKLRHD